MPYNENLSDSRGSSAGIKFFRIMLKIMGVNRTCEFVWVVAFFYTLFDRHAAKAASYYISHRFPNAGIFGRFYHRWALFTSQGQSLVEAFAMREKRLEWKFDNYEECRRLKAEKKGFILLTSHFGCWQAVAGGLYDVERRVSIMMTPDKNMNVDKMIATSGLENSVSVISTESPMGGVLEAFEALDRGEVVCIMGDRCIEEHGIAFDFLGGKAKFPTAAFFIAARAGCPVMPLFAIRGRDHRFPSVRYEKPFFPVMKGRDRSMLVPYIEKYVRLLEEKALEHPHQLFMFDDVWKKE